MTLLDLRINRSYGNADYSHKRTVIFQEYMNHRYVRPHTLAVFMKGDIAAGEAQKISLNQWQLRDIRQNVENIARNIEQNFSEWLTYKD